MALSQRALGQNQTQRMAPLQVLRDRPDTLLVHEIYRSLQGEGTHAGLPCTFIRLTGCHLRCRYCDSEAAFEEGSLLSLEELRSKARELSTPLLQITGGEPLLQKAVHPLMTMLCDDGFTILLETSGAISTSHVDERVIVILDVKTPSSGEDGRNRLENLRHLRAKDEVKFVISDKEDYDFSLQILREHPLGPKENEAEKPTVLFSPEADSMDPALLAEWILRDGLEVRFQLQLHKVLWGNRSGV